MSHNTNHQSGLHSITLLGTGTCQIEAHRMASSALISTDNENIVFDMGRGITQRLVELGLKHDDIDHIILSHFHPDHISDLAPFLQAANWSRTDPRTKPLNIYGPAGTKDLHSKFCALFGKESMLGKDYDLHIHDIEDSQFQVGSLKMDYVDLPPADNHGIAFTMNGKRYGLTGDSFFHQDEIEFLKALDVAVVDSGHPTDDELVELAVATNTPTIICSHLYRELSAEELNAAARAKGYTGEFVIGEDKMVITDLSDK